MSTEGVSRVDVVREARALLGCPYVHQHRMAGTGVDCAGVLTLVTKMLGLSDFDVTDYERYPEGMQLLSLCDQQMTRIPVAQMQAGDAIAMRITRQPQHVGILVDYCLGGLSMVHADNKVGRVVETPLDQRWLDRVVAAYRLPGIAA